jgi:hypothetical protein
MVVASQVQAKGPEQFPLVELVLAQLREPVKASAASRADQINQC